MRQELANFIVTLRRHLPQQMNQRQRQLLLFQIGPQRLPRVVFTSHNVEEVVGDLEGDPQRTTESVQCVADCRRRPGIVPAQVA